MATYQDIKQANDTIRTTDIKGKEYAEVNQRIRAFRMVHPNGTITTDIISLEDGVVTMKACVLTEDGQMLGSGYAQEKEGSTFINKTSFIENCETSAVGRALGMCGFGIDTDVSSYEEVQNAMNNQEEKPKVKATPQQVEIIKSKAEDLNKILKYYEVKTIEEMTVQQASHCIEILNAKKAKGA